ncbi:tetratricopeptide repeat protein [Patescibacteria group bacterium]|nr:tetratricopeptide repeat protein [Patescibacteria group bacterium]
MNIQNTIRRCIKRWTELPTKDNWRENNWARTGAILALLGLLTIVGFNLAYDFVPLNQLSSQASQARLAGDDKTALRLYRVVSARASKIDYSSNYELGNILSEMGQYTVAEKHYLRASNNPAAPMSVYYQLSDLYLKYLQKKQQHFINLLKQRITDQPTHDGFVVILAGFYQQIGDKEQAIIWYEQALELDPNNAGVKSSLLELKASL